MKKVINGRRYNTEAAKLLGECWDGIPSSLDYRHEMLYVNTHGAYFLYGEGGPQTQYAEKSESGGWKSGEKIVPLTPETAREWAEENLTTDEYERAFGDAPEPELCPTLVKLAPELRRELDDYCYRNNVTIKDTISNAIAAYIQ